MPTEDPADSGGTESLPAQIAIREMLDVERMRLERDNRRSNITEKALELADTQDRRQFEYASATLNANMQIQVDRMVFLRRLAWVCASFFAILVSGCWVSPSTAMMCSELSQSESSSLG